MTGHRKHKNRDVNLVAVMAAKKLVLSALLKHAVLILGGAGNDYDQRYSFDWLVMKEAYENNVPYILRLPYAGRERAIPLKFVEAAIQVTSEYDEYKVQGYHVRDRRMVDEGDVTHSFWDGRKCWFDRVTERRRCSGTWNTIKYAFEQGKPVHNWYTGEAVLLKGL